MHWKLRNNNPQKETAVWRFFFVCKHRVSERRHRLARKTIGIVLCLRNQTTATFFTECKELANFKRYDTLLL